jgi:hypothetical protein
MRDVIQAALGPVFGDMSDGHPYLVEIKMETKERSQR